MNPAWFMGHTKNAQMVELVDTRDSKSRDFGHESSILSLGTHRKLPSYDHVFSAFNWYSRYFDRAVFIKFGDSVGHSLDIFGRPILRPSRTIFPENK